MFRDSRRTRLRWLVPGTTAVAVVVVGTAVAAAAGLQLNPFGTSQVGTQPGGRVLLPTNQWISSYGQRTQFTDQVIGTGISPDGGKLAVQTGGLKFHKPSLEIVDGATGSVLQSFGGTGVAAPVYSADGTALYAATGISTQKGGANRILKYRVGSDGLIANPTSPEVTELGDSDLPFGLALSADGSRLYVAFSGSNALGVVDTSKDKVVDTIAVGNAPQDVAIVGNQAFVSNRGGRPATSTDTTNDSSGTAIVSDPVTGASATGTVSVVDLATDAVTDTIDVGLQPAALTVHDGSVFVSNTNSDTVSIIDAASHKVTQTFNVEPLPGSSVGASPNSVTFADPQHLLVSVGRDNAIAVFGYQGPRTPLQYQGLIPTDWYPNQVTYDAKLGKVIVANQQGVGSNGGATSGPYQGTLTSFPLPSHATLGSLTRQVFTNNGWDHINAATGTAASAGALPTPLAAVPPVLGQPSAIKHVFLIIKENRTYDQIFGDIGKGNSNPNYTDYGLQDTPNQHSLANTFTLFDNFYDNGMVSADGHSWLLQGDNNDYLQQDAASTWDRSYPYPGGDALAYQRDGFIWNTVQAAGKTVKNYGEFESKTSGQVGTWQQYYADSQILEGKASGPLPVALDQLQSASDVPSLNAISNPDYPRFNVNIPDQYRTDVWERDFQQAEQSGQLPNLTIMQLPNDHTGGAADDTAQMADNDLAVGRIVSDVSHSQFWKDSAIFVLEDDTQAGADHVDGHRGPLLIASPYATRGAVNSDYYSQINVVKTIEQILGARPMNQMDRAAVPMFDAFTNTPNLTPYETVPNQVPLTQGVSGLLPLTPAATSSPGTTAPATTNGPTGPAVPATSQALATAWASWYRSEAQPKLTGASAQEDSTNPAQLNRYDWYSATNWSKPYPGDQKILAPDEVPGRNLPSNLLDD